MASPNYTLYQGGNGVSGAGFNAPNGGAGGTSYPSGYAGARGGRYSGNYVFTTWTNTLSEIGEPGMPGAQTVALGDWGGVTYGGYGYGGGGGGEDEGYLSGGGGAGAPGFVTLNFDCGNSAPGGGGLAPSGQGGVLGAPSSLLPPVRFTLAVTPVSQTVYNGNSVNYTATATMISGTAPLTFQWTVTGSGNVAGINSVAPSGNTAIITASVTTNNYYTPYSGGPYNMQISCRVTSTHGFSTQKYVTATLSRLA